jgi:hypothetical protein
VITISFVVHCYLSAGNDQRTTIDVRINNGTAD